MSVGFAQTYFHDILPRMNTDLSERERGSEGERERGCASGRDADGRNKNGALASARTGWAAPATSVAVASDHTSLIRKIRVIRGQKRKPHHHLKLHHNSLYFNHLRSRSQLTTHYCERSSPPHSTTTSNYTTTAGISTTCASTPNSQLTTHNCLRSSPPHSTTTSNYTTTAGISTTCASTHNSLLTTHYCDEVAPSV
jgi:hypothetical protein